MCSKAEVFFDLRRTSDRPGQGKTEVQTKVSFLLIDICLEVANDIQAVAHIIQCTLFLRYWPSGPKNGRVQREAFGPSMWTRASCGLFTHCLAEEENTCRTAMDSSSAP